MIAGVFRKNSIWAGSIFSIIIFSAPYVVCAASWASFGTLSLNTAIPIGYNGGVFVNSSIVFSTLTTASADQAWVYIGSTSAVSSTNYDSASVCTLPSSTGVTRTYCSISFVVPSLNYIYLTEAGLSGLSNTGYGFTQVFATSSVLNSTTTLNLVGLDNTLATTTDGALAIDVPNSDYFEGIVLFMMSAWFMVWLFRKHR